MKALPTHYKYGFPRRSEARWALFFDACGVKWDYTGDKFDKFEYMPTFLLYDVKIVTSLGVVTRDLYVEASFSSYNDIDEFIDNSPLFLKNPVFKVGQLKDIDRDLMCKNKNDYFYSLSRVTLQNEFGIFCLNKYSGIILCEYNLYKDLQNLEYDIDKTKTYEAYFLASELGFNGGMAECNFYTKDEDGILHGEKHELELQYLCDVSSNIVLSFPKKEYTEHWVNDDKIIKKKLPLIKKWRKEHPEGKPHECMKAVDSNFETVRAFWHESENNNIVKNETSNLNEELLEIYKEYKRSIKERNELKAEFSLDDDIFNDDFIKSLNNISLDNQKGINENDELLTYDIKSDDLDNVNYNCNEIKDNECNFKDDFDEEFNDEDEDEEDFDNEDDDDFDDDDDFVETVEEVQRRLYFQHAIKFIGGFICFGAFASGFIISLIKYKSKFKT